MKKVSLFVLSALFVVSLAASAGAPKVTIISRPAVLLVIGPIESIDRTHAKAVVLGQSVSIDANAQVSLYEITGLYGTAEANGTQIASSAQSRVLYIAGFTPVLLTGTVAKSDPKLARITIGTAVVDLTNTLSTGHGVVPAVGTLVQLVGIQPVEHGIILADAIRVGSEEIANASLLETLNLAQLGLDGSGITGSGWPKPPVD